MNPRPRRIGGFNALDDLLPGPDIDPAGAAGPAGMPAELGWAAGPGEQPQASADTVARAPRRLPAEQREPDRRARPSRPDRHAGPNALDDLLPGPGGFAGRYAPGGYAGQPAAAYQPAPRADKVRMTFVLPSDVIDAAEDAAAFLSGPPTRLTMRALTEQALRNEVDRLADVYHGGAPFPPRRRHG